jgi:Type I phosphodiesterase / nucleotide pyrophosphatase
VCLTSIATGAHPDVHHVPHLVWYHRGEHRLVEYGSSFPAMRAAGARRALQDAVFEMTRSHLARGATTVFEALEDAGLVTAAINFTCYRGRTRHAIRLPAVMRRNRWFEAVDGPTRFFFFNLFESDPTGAPLAIRSRTRGSIDSYAAVVGRWLVTRDGFDFLVFYLPDFDYASHALGPEAALEALEHADAALAELIRAAGGVEQFLERYAIVVCSDHGQTPVERGVALGSSLALEGNGVIVAASNRAGMIYRLPGCAVGARELAERLDDDPGADVVLFREDGVAVARREGRELRFAPENGGWRREGERDVLGADRYPNALERSWRALACPNAGDVLVSAAEGHEFADLGGSHHAGGGSHGSLLAGDSTVPVIAVGLKGAGLDSDELSVTDVAPIVLSHFGVEVPASMRAVAHG